MIENNQKRRNTRTKQAIHDAFVQMILENTIEEINVKSLTDRAKINRKTFYLHYTCIEALFEDELLSLSQQYTEQVSKLPIPFTYSDLTRVFFEFISHNRYRELMFCSTKYADFSNKLILMNMKRNREINNPFSNYSVEMQNIINAFVTNASMTSFRQWVEDGKKVPMEEVIQVVSSLLENGVNSITHKQ